MQVAQHRPDLVPGENHGQRTADTRADSRVEALELAVEIYNGVDSGAAGAPVSALEQVLGQLEEAEAALWEASQ